MHKLGRMLVAALLALTVLLPTAAVAGEGGDAPLADVPSEYVPALRAAADGLGVSYDELTSASAHELKTLLCDKLDEMSTEEVVAKARAALDEAPEEELGDAERERLKAKLPAIIERLASKYCDGDDSKDDDVKGDDVKDVKDDDVKDDDAKDDDVKDDDAKGDDVKDDDVKDDDVKGDDVKDVKDDDVEGDDIPVPTRVDTGGGGAGGAGMVPVAFGALFAGLFGLVGVGVTRRSTG